LVSTSVIPRVVIVWAVFDNITDTFADVPLAPVIAMFVLYALSFSGGDTGEEPLFSG